MTTSSSASTELEIELTFLASSMPVEVDSAQPKRLVDVYFPVDMSTHPRVRLRQKGDSYEFTKKTRRRRATPRSTLNRRLPFPPQSLLIWPRRAVAASRRIAISSKSTATPRRLTYFEVPSRVLS